MGALEGLRVLEAGTLIAGPFCGQLLADHGAEVIKIEPPPARRPGGDPMRQWGQGKPVWFPVIARNKKTITLDLSDPRGQALVRRLVRRADIMVENFRPGTLEGWNLGWEVLRAENPGLILVRVSGYGQSGPYARRAGFGAIGEAMGGLRALVGEPDRPPARVGISIGDSLAATFACLGALMALHHRHRTGEGQVVDSAIYEAVLAVMESTVPEYTEAGVVRERSGSILPGNAPSNVYPCRDGEILIGANQDGVFRRLCEAMGAPELARDPRYATHAARGANQAELDARIAAWTAGLAVAEALARLEAAGVPAGRLYRVPDMLEDPHFAAREALVAVPHPEYGSLMMQAVAPRLSATPGAVRWAGPPLGAHNDEIYRGLLGLSDAELADLRQAGVI
ncbi:CaiB/BaiF CoA transferase family protein [Thermaurantiacus tibetensis]|uniref:CaiB/BaiF CoA transferase family protein n=1 Tax=Thermaurantiacus tibetensis TaxID=2759035 RepID=UPI001890A44B|nr:CoA transferase [Thermaurantiacus tibetensis]